MSRLDVLKPVQLAWAGLSLREQALLAGLAAILIGVLGWYGVVQPAQSWRAEAERDFAAALQSYETTLVQLEQYQALAARAERPEAREPLRTLADRVAREHSLAISRIQPLDDGGLGVWLDASDADAVMAWLAALSREHGVMAVRASLDRESASTVRVQVVLRHAGGG